MDFWLGRFRILVDKEWWRESVPSSRSAALERVALGCSLGSGHGVCLFESKSKATPWPHHKQQPLSTSISSTMSNKRKDSSLNRLSSLKKARLRSPIPQSLNDSTGAACSSSALMMRTPSSAIRTADSGMAAAGEIPDNPSDHQANIDPHVLEHCRRSCWTPFTWDCPALATVSPCLDWSVLLKILLF